jgi:lysophospholipase L1-like esterase
MRMRYVGTARSGAGRWMCLAVLTVGSGCSSDPDQVVGGATGFAGQAAPQTMPAAGSGGSVAIGGSAGSGQVGSSAGTGAAIVTAGTTASAGNSGSAGSTGAAGKAGSGGATAAAGSPAAGGGGSGAAGVAAAGGASGVTGAAGAAGSAGSGPGGHEDLGQGDGKDVVTIGDSWMNLITQGIEQSLDKVSSQKYRHYAVPGTLMLNEQIPNQFTQAVMANKDIKTIVMTGGGNDILTSSCADTACNSIVDQVGERITKLLADMNTAGVQDVVIIGYAYPDDQTKRASLDHSKEISAKVCKPTGTPRCYPVDSTKLMITLQDGIHPNAAGDDTVAKTVWELMKSEGMRR